MANVRAYKDADRMLVQFFDSGIKDELRCPECRWSGIYKISERITKPSTKTKAVNCPQCRKALAVVTQVLEEFDERVMFY